MQLTFESLAELQDFVQWVQAARQAAPVEPSKTTIVVRDLPEVSAPTAEAEQEAEQVEDEAPATKAVTVRKRRTKAEMEAARAAEVANPIGAEPADSSASASSTADSADTHVAPNAEQTASAPISDAQDFIQARMQERPEVSQVEHLNLARTFIGKHGMEKYNASFPLAGLTPNVMSYSPADCATHAAALDFLSLE